MMPPQRFVILEHTFEGVHYDLMFEIGAVLRTWKVWQPLASGQRRAAEFLADHRRLYLDYEGPVSGDRGQVTQWDAGTYTGNAGGEPPIRLHIEGKRLRGTLTLHRDEQSRWEVQFEEG